MSHVNQIEDAMAHRTALMTLRSRSRKRDYDADLRQGRSYVKEQVLRALTRSGMYETRNVGNGLELRLTDAGALSDECYEVVKVAYQAAGCRCVGLLADLAWHPEHGPDRLMGSIFDWVAHCLGIVLAHGEAPTVIMSAVVRQAMQDLVDRGEIEVGEDDLGERQYRLVAQADSDDGESADALSDGWQAETITPERLTISA